ncbi:MAG: hypothetical protein AUG06_01125 [Actinobacteria bacterium 13_1_20CM_2_65_11]|nr:MAG: hypothetical protein AUH40_01425 [Chloroflexi bacterium 13_1_40CM_65_17]OLD23470.1 MAG: hypothetical protein AUJ02_10535 [Chloroflexi bacterium 13_1_40CM_3_65_12]OLD49345.1 MAG: hypothetical protein AUI42_08195 [Actinobacteria bacterium 13_1_40CM_2_65_8]OLE81439.1 MAG: hypothetical protein AUG06_01125 [Actinobacteria bacterium 13_1_20CM_2_65_11]
MTKFFAEREGAITNRIDEIERQVKAGRKAMDRTFHLVEKQVVPVMSTRRAQVASGAILFAFVALGVGILVYRRRRRPTLASRIRKVLPEDLRPRIKRALG